MKMRADLTGQKFGKLTVLKEAGKDKQDAMTWYCKCDCGNENIVRSSRLKNGSTQSCGCLQKERTKEINKNNKIDLTNQRFGYLTVINEAGRDKYRQVLWRCKCDCGNETIVCGGSLRKRETQSCGCYNKEILTKHGQHKTRTYSSWHGMIARCYKPNDSNYKYYGEREIKVYRKWWKFENFYKDMGDRPKNMTLERIDNNKGYYPSNCKWATMQEQARNVRCKGYYYNKELKKWIAGITINYKSYYLGAFDSEKDAKQKYLEAKEKYHKNNDKNKRKRRK